MAALVRMPGILGGIAVIFLLLFANRYVVERHMQPTISSANGLPDGELPDEMRDESADERAEQFDRE